MPGRLVKLYRRKLVVNVNVNIVAAGLLAVTLTLIPIHFSRRITDNELVITLLAGACDIVFDVVIYYFLHWIANHWRRRKTEADGSPAPLPKPFFRDATLIQFERALLSPIYYTVALGLKFLLLKGGMEREWALLIGFTVGLMITRVLHTLWGLRNGRFHDYRAAAIPTPPARTSSKDHAA